MPAVTEPAPALVSSFQLRATGFLKTLTLRFVKRVVLREVRRGRQQQQKTPVERKMKVHFSEGQICIKSSKRNGV